MTGGTRCRSTWEIRELPAVDDTTVAFVFTLELTEGLKHFIERVG